MKDDKSIDDNIAQSVMLLMRLVDKLDELERMDNQIHKDNTTGLNLINTQIANLDARLKILEKNKST